MASETKSADTPAAPPAPTPAPTAGPAFDGEALDNALKCDWYATVFATLRDFMDNHRDRRAADWIVHNALCGHMVALYMLQRNRVKYTQAVMSTMELELALESALIAVIRTHEDAAACTLALGEDRDAGAVAFIRKLQHWWSQHGDPKTWPTPAAVMSNATKHNRMRNMVADSTVEGAPQPTWLLDFSYSTYTPSWAVSFMDPVAGKSSACRTNHNVGKIRAAVRSTLITEFSKPDATWEDVWSVKPSDARKDVKLETKAK